MAVSAHELVARVASRMASQLGGHSARLVESGKAEGVFGAGENGENSSPIISHVTHDSRSVTVGSLFCCVRGAGADGHRFANEAVAKGAVCLLVDHVVETTVPVTQIVVDDTRAAMGWFAAGVLDFPADQLTMIGITGTNGKTTTAQLLSEMLQAEGRRVGVIGTLTQARTTPEATDLQVLLRSFVDDGCDLVVMEVSSHALELQRVAGIRFQVAVFTNLSQDHLDFHDSMESYFRAKARLFTKELTERALVNLDDQHGHLLFDAAVVPTDGYSIKDATDLELSADHSAFSVNGLRVELSIGGMFNVSNALAAIAVARLLGVTDRAIVEATRVAYVPGRFEPVRAGQPFVVLVDFAHTPDGLDSVLRSARSSMEAESRLIVVFGCGGDRDAAKRPIMGRIATDLADLAVLTSDNPRSEPPMSILEQVVAGVLRNEVLQVIEDRRTAIEFALRAASAGDVVVIAGKGHENGQQVGATVHPFNDRSVAESLLTEMGWTR